MEKVDAVNKLLENGILISPKLIESINEQTLTALLSTQHKELVLSSIKEPDISYIVSSSQQKQSFSVNDFIAYNNQKYELIKSLLVGKINPISINKLKTVNGEASIIAAVSEKSKNRIYLEDPTGKVEAMSDKDLPENVIFGIIGTYKEGIFLVNRAIYPDIQLDRKIKAVDVSAMLSITPQKTSCDFIITPNSPETERTITNFITPATITLKKGNTSSILIFRQAEDMPRDKIVKCLKQRVLPEQKTPNENCLIKDVPDVVWIIQKSQWTCIYKGVTIISGESAEINLKSREVKFV